MRTVRFVLTLLIVGSLAMLPVSAAMAMSHASNAEMSMSASPGGEPCSTPAERDDGCSLACCHIQLLAVEQPAAAQAPAHFGVACPLGGLPGAAFGPDPPPPRS